MWPGPKPLGGGWAPFPQITALWQGPHSQMTLSRLSYSCLVLLQDGVDQRHTTQSTVLDMQQSILLSCSQRICNSSFILLFCSAKDSTQGFAGARYTTELYSDPGFIIFLNYTCIPLNFFPCPYVCFHFTKLFILQNNGASLFFPLQFKELILEPLY